MADTLEGVPNKDCQFGWQLHSVAKQQIQDFAARAEEHFTWIREVVAEAKKTFAS